MFEYKKRNWIKMSDIRLPGPREELELVLRLDKSELFDSHVLLPHSRVSKTVYETVNQFVERYKGSVMSLVIFSEEIIPEVQNVFCEAYRSHYEAELRKVNRFLHRRYLRVILLLVASAAAYWCSGFLRGRLGSGNFFLDFITNLSVFCMWEIGYTHFARIDAVSEKHRIQRAMNAEISFMKVRDERNKPAEPQP